MSNLYSFEERCTFCNTVYSSFIKGKAIAGIMDPSVNPAFIVRDEYLYYLYVYKNEDTYKYRMITKCPVCRRKLKKRGE